MNTETTHKVMLDYPGLVDPQVVHAGIGSFETANYHARKVFNEETHNDTELDPNGAYKDLETDTEVWVVVCPVLRK